MHFIIDTHSDCMGFRIVCCFHMVFLGLPSVNFLIVSASLGVKPLWSILYATILYDNPYSLHQSLQNFVTPSIVHVFLGLFFWWHYFISSLIIGLHLPISPSAVIWFVISIVIYAIYCQIIRISMR